MNLINLVFKYFATAPASDYMFYLAMMIVAVLSKIYYKKRELLVNIIAAIGMVGTFAGICIALQEFDSSNITESVPVLLTGMKTAFYTSLIGTSFSIGLKIIYGLKGTKQDPMEKEFFDNNEITREYHSKLLETNLNILNELKYHTQEFNLSRNNQITTLEEIRTLVQTIKNTNENITTSNNNVIQMLSQIDSSIETFSEGFSNFKKTMAKENNEAFIEALNICVKDLNQEMMEQLGENFNKFNDGMFKLISWQEKYIEIIDQTEKNQEKIIDTFTIIEDKLSKSADSISHLSEKAKDIMDICSGIKTLTNELKDSTNSTIDSNVILKDTISKLTNMNDDLITFKNSLNDVVLNINEVNSNFTTALVNTSERVNDFQYDLNEYNNNSKEMHRIFVDNMRRELDVAARNINDLNSALKTQCKEVATSTAVGMEITNKKVGELLDKHINNIENQLGRALTSSLMSLGEELAALSNKFVEDYSPLTDKLKEIIKIAERVR